ncbi:MAG: hypothetical protein EXS03_02330 [Phycisphaerales bacterium]|nr:hypothetical protein [Phycisphaerales bacterium]
MRDPISTPKRRTMRWIRRSAALVVALTVAVAVVVALAPWILSGSIGRSLLVDAIAPYVNGAVSVQGLSLSWGGPQTVTALSIRGSDGAEVVLNAQLRNTLVEAVRMSAPPRITVSGSIQSKYRSDGSLTLTDLLRRDAASGQAVRHGASSDGAHEREKPRRALHETLDGASLEIAGLRFAVTPSEGGPEIEISALQGSVQVNGGDVVAELSSPTRVGAKSGSFAAKGRINAMLAADGPADCAVDLEVSATSLAIPAQGIPLEVETASLRVASARLGDAVHVEGVATIIVPTGERANLSLAIDAVKPLSVELMDLTGKVSIEGLPTSALSPYLPAAIVVERDIGPSVTASATFAGRTGSATVTSRSLTIEGAARLTDQGDALTIDRLAIHGAVDPVWVPGGLATQVPIGITITGSVGNLPLPTESAPTAWANSSFDFAVVVDGASLRVAETPLSTDPATLMVGPTTITVNSSRLADGLHASLNSTVNGAVIAADQTVVGLVGNEGISIEGAHAKGTISLTPLGLATLPWLSPEVVAALATSGISSVATTITNDASMHAGNARVSVALSDTVIATTIDFTDRGYSSSPITADLLVTPALAATLAGESVDLATPASLSITVAPITGTWEALRSGDAIPTTIEAGVSAVRVELAKAPGLIAGAVIEDLIVSSRLGFSPTGELRSIDGSIRATMSSVSAKVAEIAGTITMDELSKPDFKSTVEVSIAPGSALASLLEYYEAAAVVIGPGSIKASLIRAGEDLSIDGQVTLPRVSLATSARVTLAQPLSIEIAATTGSFDLPATLVEGALGLRPRGDWRSELASTSGRSVKGSLNIEAIRWTGRAQDAAFVARATIEPGTLESAQREPISFDRLALSVESPQLATRIAVGITGAVGVGSGEREPLALTMNLVGKLAGVLGDVPASSGTTVAPVTLSKSEIALKVPGSLALAALDWARGTKDASATFEQLGAIDARVDIASMSLPATGLAQASCYLSLAMSPISMKFAGQLPIELGSTLATLKSARLGDTIDLSLATGGVKTGSIEVTASGRGQADSAGRFSPLLGSWTAKARAATMKTAFVDALVGAGGRLTEALGDSLDLTLDAAPAPLPDGSSGTVASMAFKSQALIIDAPRVTIAHGLLAINQDAPMTATLAINKALQKRLLGPVNPVLADIRSAPPIRALISSCRFPADADLAKFDLDARIEFGDVEVVCSNQILGVLALAQESQSQTIPARIEPLVIAVRAGQLKYSDFVVKAGKYGDQWKQILKLAGDIDLTTTPPYARAITCRYPLASLGRTIGGASGPFSTTLSELSDQLQKLPIDPGMLFDVDVTLHGPLGDVNGQARPLESKVRLAFDPSAIDVKKVQSGISDIGKTIDGLRKLFGQ